MLSTHFSVNPILQLTLSGVALATDSSRLAFAGKIDGNWSMHRRLAPVPLTLRQ
jgi:hypothetical protein